jgi:hypothetical protein
VRVALRQRKFTANAVHSPLCPFVDLDYLENGATVFSQSCPRKDGSNLSKKRRRQHNPKKLKKNPALNP